MKEHGYINITDTTIASINLGDLVTVINGDFLVNNSATSYVGICDYAGYFRLTS